MRAGACPARTSARGCATRTRVLRYQLEQNEGDENSWEYQLQDESACSFSGPSPLRSVFCCLFYTNSPCITVTACPPSFTRSPSTRTFTTPPRAEAW